MQKRLNIFVTHCSQPHQRYFDLDPHYLRIPYVEKGMVVGLFGGSFNPPHDGHTLVADIALRRLGLNQLWWLITPGNPLKENHILAPLAQRIIQSQKLATDPRIKITAFEAAFHLLYTVDTLAFIKARNRDVAFVWIMGADHLADFHHWQHWRRIMMTCPIAVIDRPGSTLSYLSSPMAKAFHYARINAKNTLHLARYQAPAWTFLSGPRSSLSSTQIRKTMPSSQKEGKSHKILS